MKKIITISLMALVFSCSKKEEGYSISGDLTGFESKDMVYINTVSDANRPIIIDSIQMIDGKFSLDLPAPTSKDFYFLSFAKSTKGNILFISENKALKIKADVNDLRGARIDGGEENKTFVNFLDQINKLGAVAQDITKENNIAKQNADYPGLQNAQKRKDSLAVASKEMRLRILGETPNTVAAIMALTDLVSQKMIKSTEAKAYYEKFTPEMKSSRLGRNAETAISSIIETSNKIGDKVSNFTAPSLSGEKLSLNDNLGKITILDFWASWCRPCRAENPNVVRIYNKYKSKGLEIIGISFDQKAEKWQKAVENDGLTWKHVSNLKGWQEPLGKPFGVRSIPTTYLLDENGVIIAKNLRGQALENKIAELLN